VQVCPICQTQFELRRGRRKTYCSRACGFEALRHDRAAAKQERQVGAHTVVAFGTCKECGGAFVKRQIKKIYCSLRCGQVATQKAKTPQRQHARECRECGVSFKPAYGDKRSTYCSDSCKGTALRRVRRHIERARLKVAKVEPVDPLKVFARDGWRCQECKSATPRNRRGTYHPRAPELDHIIPLSKGGEHSYRNTQCLCRGCNGAKSNTERGQLRLFG
jgi:5-methylcytosine-specific restriction endonuclease McrA